VNRLERLINLVAALLDADRPLSRHELSVLVPGYEGSEQSVRRAFERDKEALRAMGIPVVTELVDPEAGDGVEGYRIPREQYELPDPGLAPDELAALHLAATMVQLDGAPGHEALWKLGGAPSPAPGAGDLVALRGDQHLPALFAAIGERRTVRFRYRGGERTVDPYLLSFRNGFWYLAGHDHSRGEERSFRLDRMESAPDAGEPGAFERPAARAARRQQPWEMGDDEAVDVRVEVDADQAPWVVAELGEDAVEEHRPDGGVVVSMRVSSRPAFRSFVLGLLDHAVVIDPPEARDDLVDWLKNIA
jgi:proteasome accessory factor B